MSQNERVTSLSALPRRQVMFTLAGVMLAVFISSLDQTIVGTAMPRIVSELGGFSHYTWITTAYIIASAVTMPITGKLTDMYGRKYFFIAGLAIFTIFSLLCGLGATMMQLIIFRGLQGVGAGVMMANSFTVIGDLFPPSERGKYVGLISGVFGISSIIGPVLGGFITDALSWHWVFFVNVPLGIIIIALFFFFFPHVVPDTHRHQVDYAGLIALILAVVPAMLALSWVGAGSPLSSLQLAGLFVFAALMTVAFCYIEMKAKEPIIPLSLFRNRIISISIIVSFLTAFGMFGVIIFVPLYFQGVLGLSATASGSFLTPMTVSQVLASFISGQLLSRAGGRYRIQGFVGIVFMALGMYLLSRMTPSTSYGVAVFNIVLCGFGLGIIMPLYMIIAQNAAPHRILGVATSSIAFFRSIGGSVGLAIFGSIMTNRFAAEFLAGLSPAVRAVFPVERLNEIAQNPQALVSPQAQEQLNTIFGAQGAEISRQLMETLRQSLNSAITQIFLFALVLLVIALVAHLFIKEIPLRKQHHEVTEHSRQQEKKH